MTHVDSTRYRVPFSHLVEPTRFVGETLYEITEAVIRAANRAGAAVVKKVRTRRTVNEVSTLSDYILKDIGIERSEIELLARHVAENPNVDYRVLRSW